MTYIYDKNDPLPDVLPDDWELHTIDDDNPHSDTARFEWELDNDGFGHAVGYDEDGNKIKDD